jgi:hypothetical protein
MFARLRLIVCVLLVALPLQGLAASTRALCEHGHAAGFAQSAVTEHVANEDDRPHVHPPAGAAAHASHDFANGYGTAADAGAALVAGSCAHCAACSVATALIGSALELPEVLPAHADFPPRRIASPSRPFDGPERPPRTI